MVLTLEDHFRSRRMSVLKRLGPEDLKRPLSRESPEAFRKRRERQKNIQDEATSTWCRFFKLASILMLAAAALSADAAAVGMRPEGIHISGSIAPGDAAKVAALLKGEQMTVSINSPGGDVYEAMRLGRLLRARRATIEVTSRSSMPRGSVWESSPSVCASACILVYAGATTRYVSFWQDTTGTVHTSKLLVHRPYFQSVSPANARAYWQRADKDIRSYLAEMNVPQRLADLMNATPPERARELSYAEREELLPSVDPAEEEMGVAQNAFIFGISSAEYRRRRERAGICDPPLENAEDHERLERSMTCTTAIIGGFSYEEAERRRIAAKKCEWGAQTPEELERRMACLARALRK